MGVCVLVCVYVFLFTWCGQDSSPRRGIFEQNPEHSTKQPWGHLGEEWSRQRAQHMQRPKVEMSSAFSSNSKETGGSTVSSGEREGMWGFWGQESRALGALVKSLYFNLKQKSLEDFEQGNASDLIFVF